MPRGRTGTTEEIYRAYTEKKGFNASWADGNDVSNQYVVYKEFKFQCLVGGRERLLTAKSTLLLSMFQCLVGGRERQNGHFTLVVKS